MRKITSLIFAISLCILVITVNHSFAGEEITEEKLLYPEETCYDLGYRYGLCATQSMVGLQCKPKNDFAMPERCRGKEDTKKGIASGVKAVYDTLGVGQ